MQKISLTSNYMFYCMVNLGMEDKQIFVKIVAIIGGNS